MNIEKELKECFRTALRDEQKGKKHKGLLITKPNDKEAELYIIKAKENLRLCNFYREMGFEYKIPEEWFYTLYYCALAILSKFGVETRNQKCTALFLKYVKNKNLINYNNEFIDRITIYKEKSQESDVDERERARYSSAIKIEDVKAQYDKMADVCKEAIAQVEEIVFSDKGFEVPEELL